MTPSVSNIYFMIAQNNAERKYLVSVFLTYVSRVNRSHFGSDLCFLPPFARRIFRCFRPALPVPIPFWVKTGLGTGDSNFAGLALKFFLRDGMAHAIIKV